MSGAGIPSVSQYYANDFWRVRNLKCNNGHKFNVKRIYRLYVEEA